jgi:hypothetical protein
MLAAAAPYTCTCKANFFCTAGCSYPYTGHKCSPKVAPPTAYPTANPTTYPTAYPTPVAVADPYVYFWMHGCPNSNYENRDIIVRGLKSTWGDANSNLGTKGQITSMYGSNFYFDGFERNPTPVAIS